MKPIRPVFCPPADAFRFFLCFFFFFLFCFSFCYSPAASLYAREGIVERRNQEKIRSSGFADVELDRLHEEIAGLIFDLQALALPEEKLIEDPRARPSNPREGQVTPDPAGKEPIELIPSRKRAFLRGTDRNGRTYFRLRISEGLNYTTQPTPDRFLFHAHAYFYLDEQGKLNEILLQFYRMRFNGMDYTREIRRIRHPRPSGSGSLQSLMEIEFRSYPSSLPRDELSVDGIPLPVLSGEPRLRTVLHSPDAPMPFDKQARIVETYRSMLRKLSRQLRRQKEILQLDRNSLIERAIDFTGRSF
jgi:hypothetical protein